jgi:O-antigen ligase
MTVADVEIVAGFRAGIPGPCRWARHASLWILVLTLAWAPFPLGSNREWSWSILTLLTALSWFFWSLWAGANPGAQWENLRRLAFPILSAGLALAWAAVQVLPVVPPDWIHPVWADATALLHHPLAGSISLNTWQTLSELSKLATYLAFGWLVFSLARERANAAIVLNTIIAIGALYAVYAFALAILDLKQVSLFYSLPQPGFFSGPFVLHNSFATFEGLAAIATLARIGDKAGKTILVFSGLRVFLLTTLRFAFGNGRIPVVAAILSISGLLASVSRGGFLAFLCALAALILIPAFAPQRRGRVRFLVISLVGIAIFIGTILWTNGDQLAYRFGQLVEVGDDNRIVFWNAAWHMIASAPYLGLGLGTFQDAYPMYAERFLPFILDKAHNDYLEFAAGLGLPAALLWWSAMAWCAVRVALGYFGRRRDRVYALTALCATVLVAVHASVDFSLQIPAVSLTYVGLLAVGLAQSYSSRDLNRL